MQTIKSIPSNVEQDSAKILEHSWSAACTVVSVMERGTGSSPACTRREPGWQLPRGISWAHLLVQDKPSQMCCHQETIQTCLWLWEGMEWVCTVQIQKRRRRNCLGLFLLSFKAKVLMQSCVPARLFKLRQGEFSFKELDGLLSYPWLLPSSPFPHKADAKISLKQHKGQTIIKTFHHIALTLSSCGWIHWHSSGSKNSALVPFFRDAVLLAPIQKRLQVLREYDSWPKIFVYTRLFKQFSKYFSEWALFQFDLWLRAQETSCT